MSPRAATRLYAAIAFSMSVAPFLAAQASARPAVVARTALPVYDVATIKPNRTGSGNVDIDTDDFSFVAKNVQIKMLLLDAFGIRKELIYGLPAWAETAHFDLNAKVVDPDIAEMKKLTNEQRRAMLQRLFADRFALQWHFETKILQSYELVVGKGGPKFKQSPEAGSDGVTQRNTNLTAHHVPVARLADVLSEELHRAVVDKTGLSGNYDYALKWTRDDALAAADNGKAEADAAPSLFTALQEQLGLKLQSGKDPAQTLVIDRIQMPTEN